MARDVGEDENPCFRNEFNAQYFKEGETVLSENDFIRRKREHRLSQFFFQKLSSMSTQVIQMNKAIEQAEQSQLANLERQRRETQKKSKKKNDKKGGMAAKSNNEQHCHTSTKYGSPLQNNLTKESEGKSKSSE